MAFIGPNNFCCHSIFTSFSADFAAYSLLFHSFHLTLPARHAQPPAAVPIPTPPAAPFPSTPAPTPSRPRRCVLVQPHPSLPAATRFVYAILILPLPLLGAAVQLTQIQRRRPARAHYCPRVVKPESSSLAIFLPFFSFPALCVCGHLLIATHRSTSSCCASPRVLHIGLGSAGNVGSYSTTSVPRAVRAPTALRTRRKHSIAAPRATSRIRGWALLGPYDERYKTSHSHHHDCPAHRDYEGARARLLGPSRWFVVLILTTSANRRKKAVRKGRRGKVTNSFTASTASLRAGRAQGVLRRHDESAVSPHRATRAAWCLEDGRCTTSGLNEGAERAHPRDWPTRRGYEVRELERDREVSSRSRSHSAPRAYLRSASYDDCSS
ncbi:hypothetical protein B0H13DRAFT_2681952 [Mycena leptocephala]|nr:hypothetical protein B0H13DRAFT_2681952 [Mycena leptocephala]